MQRKLFAFVFSDIFKGLNVLYLRIDLNSAVFDVDRAGVRVCCWLGTSAGRRRRLDRRVSRLFGDNRRHLGGKRAKRAARFEWDTFQPYACLSFIFIIFNIHITVIFKPVKADMTLDVSEIRF